MYDSLNHFISILSIPKLSVFERPFLLMRQCHHLIANSPLRPSAQRPASEFRSATHPLCRAVTNAALIPCLRLGHTWPQPAPVGSGIDLGECSTQNLLRPSYCAGCTAMCKRSSHVTVLGAGEGGSSEALPSPVRSARLRSARKLFL